MISINHKVKIIIIMNNQDNVNNQDYLLMTTKRQILNRYTEINHEL